MAAVSSKSLFISFLAPRSKRHFIYLLTYLLFKGSIFFIYNPTEHKIGCFGK